MRIEKRKLECPDCAENRKESVGLVAAGDNWHRGTHFQMMKCPKDKNDCGFVGYVCPACYGSGGDFDLKRIPVRKDCSSCYGFGVIDDRDVEVK